MIRITYMRYHKRCHYHWAITLIPYITFSWLNYNTNLIFPFSINFWHENHFKKIKNKNKKKKKLLAYEEKLFWIDKKWTKPDVNSNGPKRKFYFYWAFLHCVTPENTILEENSIKENLNGSYIFSREKKTHKHWQLTSNPVQL